MGVQQSFACVLVLEIRRTLTTIFFFTIIKNKQGIKSASNVKACDNAIFYVHLNGMKS